MNETEKGEMSFSGNPMSGEQDFMKNEVPVSQPLFRKPVDRGEGSRGEGRISERLCI